jgi:hypothetical protein
MLAPGVAGAHGGGKQQLRVVATELQSELVDVGDPGPSLGDQLVFSEKLRVRGRHVGMSGVVCTVTHAVPPYDVLTYLCVGTLSLRNGQIAGQGLLEVQGEDDPGPFTVAITGGTGAYRGVSGEIVLRDRPSGVRVYTLRFDTRKQRRHGHGHHRH